VGGRSAACWSPEPTAGACATYRRGNTSDLSTPLWNRSRPYPAADWFEPGGQSAIAIGADGLIYSVGAYPVLMIFDAAGNPVSCHDHRDEEASQWASGVAVSDVALVTSGSAFTCDGGGGVSLPGHDLRGVDAKPALRVSISPVFPIRRLSPRIANCPLANWTNRSLPSKMLFRPVSGGEFRQ
jgi:hypothetical protein